MAKRLEMTDQIKQRIAASAGPEVDPDKVVAFETIAANTLPLNKKGSLFHQGRISPETLALMSGVPAKGGVPLHTVHNQGGELPVGKVFYSDVMPTNDGGMELRSQFYLPVGQAALIEGLDTGVVDEVSVGVRPTQILCSACNYDYAAPEASIMNILNQCCPDGHTVGKDGAHVVMKGLDRWLELSLVSRGAADKPKVVGRTKALLGDARFNELVASGVSPDATTLFGTVTKDENMSNIDVDKLVANLAAETGKTAVLTAEKGTLTAQLAEVNTKLAAAEKQVVDLTAAAGEPGVKLAAEVEKSAKLQADIDAAVAFMTENLKASNVALGKKVEDKDLPKDIAGLTAALSEATVSVHKFVPVGGKSNQVGNEAEQSEARLAAFK